MFMRSGKPAAAQLTLCLGVCAAAFAALAPVASGQQPAVDQTQPPAEAGGSNITTYKPDFFAEFRPNTAMDMIGRIPGFQFDGGSDARGFSGTGGNVLIDGERPPSRNDFLGAIISRIPASAVERIDIIRGGAEGIDMQGKAIVANIIRKPDAGLTGAINGGINTNTRGDYGANGSIQAQNQSDGRLLEGAFNFGFNNNTGVRARRRIAPSGAITLDATSTSANEFQNYSATGAYEAAMLGGKVRFNGQANFGTGTFSSEEERIIPGGQQVDDGENQFGSGELGVRFTRDFSGFSVELVGFQSFEHEEFASVFVTPEFTQDSDSIQDAGESIVRGTVRLPPAGAISIEGGAEAVYNWSESESATIFNGSVFELSGDAFQADELRSEAFGTLTWEPVEQLNVELGARYEWSRITGEISGETPSEKTLSYFKPRLNVSWSPIEGHEANFRIERLVDQLDFDAFASSASFENQVFGVGNPGIEPEKTWVLEARYERQFGGQNSFVVEYVHRETEDVLSRVVDFSLCGLPQPTQVFEITCNVGEEIRDSLDLSGVFELDRFGMKGGIINLGVEVRDSETIDSVTGEERRVSGDTPYGWNFSLQQTLDNGNFRWALFVEDDDDSYNFSPRSYGKQAQLMFIGANITWKPMPGWTFGAGVNNILKNGNRSWSVFYDPPRNTGSPVYLEQRTNEGATNFFVNLRKNF